MTRRLFNALSAVSLALFVALCAATVVGSRERSGPYLLSNTGPRLQVQDDKLFVFNRGLRYTGSIMGSVPRAVGFDFAGVYFRHFRLPDGTPWWTVSVPVAHLFVLSAVLPVLWMIGRNRRLARAEAGLCTRCGYDLRATPGRCPECGTIAPIPRSE